MRSVWLPFDDWADHVHAPTDRQVLVWRDGIELPGDPVDVAFYVPEYLGPASVIDVIAQMPNLKVVQTLTAGYDHLLDQIPAGVTLCNARGVHEASTAELAVGLAISGLRGFPGFVRAQDEGVWLHGRHEALADKTVLVLGAGAVGSSVIARLTPFEVNLVAVARSSRDGVHGVDELSSLLPSADVVIVVVPFDQTTRGMIDSAFLRQLKDGALFVNVSRGAVVDTTALLSELQSGRLRAALDVTDPEPLPPEHPLWCAPNTFITPHVGGDTSAFMPRAWQLLREQLNRYSNNEPLANVIAH